MSSHANLLMASLSLLEPLRHLVMLVHRALNNRFSNSSSRWLYRLLHDVRCPDLDLLQVLVTNAVKYSKGLLSEILDFVMGQGLIPADGDVWKVRRRAIVPALHKRYEAPASYLKYFWKGWKEHDRCIQTPPGVREWAQERERRSSCKCPSG